MNEYNSTMERGPWTTFILPEEKGYSFAGVGKRWEKYFRLLLISFWQGERDHAEVINREEAKKAILAHNQDI